MAKQITVTVNDRDYLLQHPGARASVQMRGRAKDRHGNVDEEKFYGEMMKHVIIGSVTKDGNVIDNVNWDYFEDQEAGGKGFGEDFDELMAKSAKFLMHIKDDADTQ